MTGTVTPVIINWHFDAAYPDGKKDKPTGRVRRLDDSIAMNGNKKAFHILKNVVVLN